MIIKEILSVYKELRDVVIFKDETGQIHIRAMEQEDGTPDEQAVIKEKVLSTGFKANNINEIK